MMGVGIQMLKTALHSVRGTQEGEEGLGSEADIEAAMQSSNPYLDSARLEDSCPLQGDTDRGGYRDIGRQIK